MTKKKTNPWSTGKATLLATTPENSLYPGTHQELRSPFHSNCSSNPTHAQNIHLNISTDNETRIRRIATALDAANKAAITLPATAPTPPPPPALPNEYPIVTRSRNALADTCTLHSPMTTQESSIDLTLQFCRPRGHVSRRQIVIGTPTLGRHSFETTSTRCTTNTDASGVMKVAPYTPAQQAVAATRKQIEITVQKIASDRTSSQDSRRLARGLDNTRHLQTPTTPQGPRSILKLHDDWTILDNHSTTARAATTNPAATDIQRRLGANVSLQKG
ncbi:hypothetical protein B0F90DRAFT_1822865 [Multifurca ochricompacta]|uniref:Uncharacterized protein n=1 Tax=Multifurca ochricompacta TaxID=376703 RepID=A0AAD4LXP9_9AGAM|nr:hypothetical protein B0F90DRAFT_1822865 [Multifurca ochricompacta]